MRESALSCEAKQQQYRSSARPHVCKPMAFFLSNLPSLPWSRGQKRRAATGAMLKTDFLIVGAGPAGASLACFLGAHGMDLAARNMT